MSDHCEILWVIRPNRYLELGNGSKKFGNHCFKWKLNKHFLIEVDHNDQTTHRT